LISPKKLVCGTFPDISSPSLELQEKSKWANAEKAIEAERVKHPLGSGWEGPTHVTMSQGAELREKTVYFKTACKSGIPKITENCDKTRKPGTVGLLLIGPLV